MALDVMTALYLLAAALIAVAIRLYDTPKSVIIVDGKPQWDVIIPPLVGAIIAAPVGAWILGLDVLIPAGFVSIVAVAYTGMAGIKALLNIAEKATA